MATEILSAGATRILRNLLSQALIAVNNGDKTEALANLTQALGMTQANLEPAAPAEDPPPDEPAESIYDRIQEQREALFGAMAMVAVTRDSIDKDLDYDRHRILEDTYNALDELGYALDAIACDAKDAQDGAP
jgi:hypothetical protein